ncbi:MAG: sigma-70 family RNA polymerase sigma factor [Eubacteriales bacterium]|nr:sigma-70 family RNA polymerase sigma factor [Eubacteriales bacterium]
MHELIKLAIHSDTEAFLQLMDESSLSMYKVARGILKNDQDIADAVQETILRCYEKIGTLKKPQYFKTWMIRILINECTNILRLRQKEFAPEEMQDCVWEESSFAEAEFKLMLDQMDEKYRVILILYYVEELKIHEIAQILDMNVSTVKTRLARARIHLKQMYFPEQKNTKGTIAGPSEVKGGISNEWSQNITKAEIRSLG